MLTNTSSPQPIRATFTVLGFVATLGLAGCALQPDYAQPALAGPVTWSALSAKPGNTISDQWWRALHDPAIDALVDTAFADNPTLAQAVARLDEARATLGVDTAARTPTVTSGAGVTRTQSASTGVPGATSRSTTANAGPSLEWEVDLFGRVRNSVRAAQDRLDARTADAAEARLTLAGDVADGVLSLRACENARAVLVDDIASREQTLTLTRRRIATGFAAPVDEARAMSGIATVCTNLASQQEQCTRQVNALVALSGKDAGAVRQLVGASGAAVAYMPQAPATVPALPATVLASHPNVVSADREAAAAWADIAVARANRLPRLDVAAVLTGQWIRAAGSTLNFTTWSVGPSLAGTLYDGGAGAANVSAAEARYRRTAASLQGTLRSTVQEVENALAAQASAQARIDSTRAAASAARITLDATEVQWKAGSVSLFELEDSRRQFASAQDAEISARRDHALAWVALVKATGGAINPTSESMNHE